MRLRGAVRLSIVLLGLAFAACSGRTAPPTAQIPVEVEVLRDGDQWTADFRFKHASPVWVFARSPLARVSGQPWRPESWVIETAGVRLERHGWYDVFVAEKGDVPERVRIRFTPFTKDIETSYDPALVFTDGSVALYDQQFKTFPAGSVEEVEKLPIDPGTLPAAAVPTRITFRDRAGPVLHEGNRLPSVMLEDAGTYVLFGPAEPLVSDAMATIIDPGLPVWLRDFLTESTPRVLAEYVRTLGRAPERKPTVMVSWAGPTPGVISMGGSVLPGLVVMTFEGEGVAEEKPGMLHQTRWFIAHESAHFWLGQTVAYEGSRDAWITEGGADLLAIRAVAATDPTYDERAELQRLLDECLKLSGGRGVSSAQERSEHRAYYACGAMFALVAEAASGQSFAAWLSPLIDENRADGILSRAEWLAALDATSGDPTLSRDIAVLLDKGAADPVAAITSLFTRVGIAHGVDADGVIRLR